MGNLTIWLTPVWVLSAGVSVGMAILIIACGLLWLVARRAAESFVRLVKESILLWISYVAIVFVAFFFLAMPVMPAKSIWHSLGRLPNVGPYETSVKIPQRTEDQEVTLAFESDELQRYKFGSEQDLVIGTEKGKAYSSPMIRVEGGDDYVWTPSSKRQRLFNGPVSKIYVTNKSDAETTLKIETRTDVPIPEVRKIPIAAAAVIGVYLLYVAIHWLLPGISTIALA